jgi:hypothetical protein
MVVAVPVKFGVGVALVVAAHFVLVRRWNNGKSYIISILYQHSCAAAVAHNIIYIYIYINNYLDIL